MNVMRVRRVVAPIGFWWSTVGPALARRSGESFARMLVLIRNVYPTSIYVAPKVTASFSGYFYKITAGAFRDVKKLLLVR
jgi:hypothetical protein